MPQARALHPVRDRSRVDARPLVSTALAFIALTACHDAQESGSTLDGGAHDVGRDAMTSDDAGEHADSSVHDASPADAGSDAEAAPKGYPGPDDTGPDLSKCPGGKLAKYTGAGDYRPENGEVVRCKEFDDRSIYVAQDVSNVTIEHCLFVTTQDIFINVQGSHVTVQDSELRGPAGTWIRNSYNGDYLIVRRNDFSGMGNAVEFNVGHETLEDNYVHDFGTASPDQHADGLQTNGTSHAVIRHNTVLLNDVAGATGAISLFGGNDILVERNKVAGGGYTIYPGGKNSTEIRFLDNCFSTQFYPGKLQTGAFGPWYPSENPPTLLRTGNTWCDGPKAGQAVNGN
ncbi:MAG: right-handed parallel beta-helix repeat-containing protein [Myxococcales bacterium]